ncbi:unnamed protein product [[Candida] boidinii]|nr:unnamed protein product [[Candida] boidinii]
MQKQLYLTKNKNKLKSDRLDLLKRAAQRNGGPTEQELDEMKNLSLQLVFSQQQIQNLQDLLSAQKKKLQLKSNSIIASLRKNLNSNATPDSVQNQTQNDNSGVIDLTEDN